MTNFKNIHKSKQIKQNNKTTKLKKKTNKPKKIKNITYSYERAHGMHMSLFIYFVQKSLALTNQSSYHTVTPNIQKNNFLRSNDRPEQNALFINHTTKKNQTHYTSHQTKKKIKLTNNKQNKTNKNKKKILKFKNYYYYYYFFLLLVEVVSHHYQPPFFSYFHLNFLYSYFSQHNHHSNYHNFLSNF